MNRAEEIVMEANELFSLLEQNKDEERAVQMSAYMRDQFSFLGISSPKRRELSRQFLKEARKKKKVDWDFINECWEKDEREFQYLAIDYLKRMEKFLTADDVPKIKQLALQKSWWDTIDALDKIIGSIALSYPEVTETLLRWSVDENIWIRRIAINHQRGRKEKTDADLLEKIIVNNLGQTEFFINKAIGWSLRDYSKINPDWVREFIKKYEDQLAPLSIREASKYI